MRLYFIYGCYQSRRLHVLLAAETGKYKDIKIKFDGSPFKSFHGVSAANKEKRALPCNY